jgi:hypothetical protein
MGSLKNFFGRWPRNRPRKPAESPPPTSLSARGDMRAMKIVALCLALGGYAPTAEQRMQQVWAQRQFCPTAPSRETQPMCRAGRNSTPLGPERKPPSKRPSRRGRRLSSCAYIDRRPPLPVGTRAIDSQRVTSGNRRKPP